MGLRWGKFAKLAQKTIEQGTFGNAFGAKLKLKWGKGAELAPKKVAEGTFEAQVRLGGAKKSLMEADFEAKLAQRWGSRGRSWGQDGGKLGPRGGKESKDEA